MNIPNHPNYNHTFCECLMYTPDAKLLIQQEKINLLLSEFPASILDGVIVVLLWGIFSGFNWASTLLIRCFICRAFSQRMKEHNINSINLHILHDKISTTQLVDYALKSSDYPQPLWAQPPDTFIGNKRKSSELLNSLPTKNLLNKYIYCIYLATSNLRKSPAYEFELRQNIA